MVNYIYFKTNQSIHHLVHERNWLNSRVTIVTGEYREQIYINSPWYIWFVPEPNNKHCYSQYHVDEFVAFAINQNNLDSSTGKHIEMAD